MEKQNQIIEEQKGQPSLFGSLRKMLVDDGNPQMEGSLFSTVNPRHSQVSDQVEEMQRNMSKYEMKLRRYMQTQISTVRIQEEIAHSYLDAKNKNSDLKNELEIIRREINNLRNGSNKKTNKFGGAQNRNPSLGSQSNAALNLNQI